MTETPDRAEEPETAPVATLPPPTYYGPAPVAARPNRLYQAVAWVAIVSGTVFIVGAVFFTGFALGRHSGDGGGWRHHGGGGNSQQFHHKGGPGMGPGMAPWGQMGPGGPGPGGPNAGPGFAPGGPGNPGPGATVTPTPRP